MGRREVALRFKDRSTFGKFCVALSEHDIPFRLSGSQTVVLAENDYGRLEGDPRALAVTAEVADPTRRAKRPSLPSQRETEALLWQFAKRR